MSVLGSSILGSSALAFAVLLPLAAAVPEPVHIESGAISGVPGLNPEVRVFEGVPYAAPPVGNLRWRSPKPAAKWEGVREAGKFGANCMQRQPNGGGFPPNGGIRPDPGMSEDCLFLNVYTAAKSARDKRPVMVWIHGGALTSGAGGIYNGEGLAAKGAVVVTINYRIGVFGYFAHPELTKESDRNASGNYGFLDQISALQWVQKNIEAFGGDPKRVTIFGESAGSWSVNYLTASPLAKGLFQRAIGESGAEFAPTRKLADVEQAGVKFAQGLGAASIADLRAKSADDLNKAPGGYSGPNVDGWFLPDEVEAIYAAGKQNDVPTLVGSNADEGTLFTPPSVKADSFRQLASRRFGADSEAYLKLYPFTSDQEARSAQAASMRDQTFGWEMRTWARFQTKTGKSKAWLYYFSHVPAGITPAMGAQHGAEIAYVFDYPNHKNAPDSPWADYDKKLGDTVSSYWYNFAAKGDPNGKGLPQWPAFRASDEMAMGFGDKIELIAVPNKPALDFLDGYYEKLWKSGSAETR
jgi:para-nitrobenzyl esterase